VDRAIHGVCDAASESKGPGTAEAGARVSVMAPKRMGERTEHKRMVTPADWNSPCSIVVRRASKENDDATFEGRSHRTIRLRRYDVDGQQFRLSPRHAVIGVWALTGPIFHYSDTWQLVINTGTTIITFLMVFLIQRTQNKESLAMQLKINEIVAALKGASNRMISVEDLSEAELQQLHARYVALAGQSKGIESTSIDGEHPALKAAS
jgi:low affinity Fe/Cu permease